MDWLNSAWVIGIGGGILSGLVVTLITRLIFSSKDTREETQKIANANREIVFAIRPGISEGEIPSREAVSALTSATARRWGVDVDKLFDATEIAQELVKEVIDSSFISAAQKSDYSSKLLSAYQKVRPEALAAAPANSDRAAGAAGREGMLPRDRMATLMSMTMGLTAALMTASLVIFSEFDKFKPIHPDGNLLVVVLPIAVTASASVVAAFLVWLQRGYLSERSKATGTDGADTPRARSLRAGLGDVTKSNVSIKRDRQIKEASTQIGL